MGNFETADAITDNVQLVLEQQGIKYEPEVIEDIDKVADSSLPLGQIFYKGEEFEYTHGQKPQYSEIEFLLRVIFRERDQRQMIRMQQEWAHKIRDSLTVNALNIGKLESSKLVSRVTTTNVDVDNRAVLSVLEYEVLIRYREL
jgi:hypothetical protein